MGLVWRETRHPLRHFQRMERVKENPTNPASPLLERLLTRPHRGGGIGSAQLLAQQLHANRHC